MSEWQPIESAPKGGGAERVDDPNWVEPPQILLCWRDGSRAIGVWDWYYAEGGHAYTDGIAWTSPIGGELLSDQFGGSPDYWMPLPDPPSPHHLHEHQRDKPDEGEQG